MPTALRCRKCGRPIAQAAGRGRPRAYCSTGCRRAMEYELRRLQSALEDVEEQQRWCRLGWYGRSPAQATKYDGERLRLEDRLRELLDDDQENPTGMTHEPRRSQHDHRHQ